MKKLFSTVALSFLIFSCGSNSKKESNDNIDYEKKIGFYRDLAIKSEKNNSEADFSKFSQKAQEKLNRIVYEVAYFDSSYLNDTIFPGNRTSTYKQQLLLVDSLYQNNADYNEELSNLFFDNQRHAMTVESVEGNIVTFSDAPGGSGASMYYEKYLIDGDNVTLLSIPDTELKKVEKLVKEKIKNYSNLSGRSDMEITQKADGIYEIGMMALTDQDAECCPSIKLSFETKDFKTVDLNSVKAEVL